MKNFPTFACAIAALAFAGAAAAQDARPMVEWVVPALPTNKPQTPEQAKAGQQYGRELPPPEVLQPMLDAKLPSYQPRKEKLVEEAESLAHSTEWANTAQHFRDLMRQWKAAGRAQRETEDKLWERFKTALYSERVHYPGVYNKQVVVVHEDDISAMLDHALIQGRRRDATRGRPGRTVKGVTSPEFDGVNVQTLRFWELYWMDPTRHESDPAITAERPVEKHLELVRAELRARGK